MNISTTIIEMRFKLILFCVSVLIITLKSNAQIMCTDYNLTSSTTEMWSGPGMTCPISVYPTGNTAWTGFSAGGFITHNFDNPQTTVNVMYYHINFDDYADITTNGGGTVTVTMVDGCVGISGNTIGPYTGGGSYGPCEIQVTSTVPFTTLTCTNVFATSGWIAGCTSIIPSLNINLGPDTTICQGDSFILDATTANCTYLWQDNSTDPTFNVTQNGTYWVEITDDVGTTASDTIVVDWFELPTVTLPVDTNICFGSNFDLDVYQLNATYLWQDGSTLPTYNVADTGWIWVELTDQCSEIAIDSMYISYLPPPTVNIGLDTSICPSGNAEFVANTTGDIDSYLWNDNSTNVSLITNVEGEVWVEVTDVCGLTAADTANIFYLQLPIVTLGNDTTFCLEEGLDITASAQNGNAFLWYEGSTGPSIFVSQSDTVIVQLTNECGVDQDTIIVYGEECESILLMPNVFTPNGDMSNDEFIPKSMQNIESADLVITNRWGNVVYQTDNLTIGWDGKINGQDCAEGVYFWKVEYITLLGEEKTIHGFVHVSR